MKNYLKAEFDAKGVNESLARIIASGFVVPLNPTIEQLSDIKTSVSEAVTNSIIHGYENNDGTIMLELELDERPLTIKVSDTQYRLKVFGRLFTKSRKRKVFAELFVKKRQRKRRKNGETRLL